MVPGRDPQSILLRLYISNYFTLAILAYCIFFLTTFFLYARLIMIPLPLLEFPPAMSFLLILLIIFTI